MSNPNLAQQPTGWEWDILVKETAYFIWLCDGNYQDRWIDEIKDYVKWNGELTNMQMNLTRFAHQHYFYTVIKPHYRNP